jgi:hypothetical protein
MAEGCEHYNGMRILGDNFGTDNGLIENSTMRDFQKYGIPGSMSRGTGMSLKGRPERYPGWFCCSLATV